MSESTYQIWIEQSKDGERWEEMANGTWTPPAPLSPPRFDPNPLSEPVPSAVVSKLISFTPCDSASGTHQTKVQDVIYRMRFERRLHSDSP